MITWESKKEQIFEMPTGGAAIMRQGPNLLKLARKEQCLALLTQLRTKFKIDGYIYRVFPNGEVQYLHPKVSAARGRALGKLLGAGASWSAWGRPGRRCGATRRLTRSGRSTAWAGAACMLRHTGDFLQQPAASLKAAAQRRSRRRRAAAVRR